MLVHNTEFDIEQNVKCDTCGGTLDCFVWYERVAGELVKTKTECYECDLETDPQEVKCLEEIEELL